MSTYPRRSARLSPQTQQSQFQQKSSGLAVPAFNQSYSQSSSTSTSSHPSPISNTLNPPPPPPTAHQPGLQLHPSYMAQQQQSPHLHAPLPSPSIGNMDPFFGRPQSQANSYASQDSHASFLGQQRQQAIGGQEQNYSSQADQQYQIPQQYDYQHEQHQLHPHTNSMSQEHPAHTSRLNPGQLPPDFLAEAAKRAELACLMRDFGDVSL